MTNLWNDIMDMLKRPIVDDLDIVHLFWLVGIVLILIAVWAAMLHYFRLTTIMETA